METQDPLDPDGLRRGPEQGDGQRDARDGRLPGRARSWCPSTATRPTRSPPWSPTAGSPRSWTSARAFTAWSRRACSPPSQVAGACSGAALASWCWRPPPRPSERRAAPPVVTTSTDLKALVREVGGARVRSRAWRRRSTTLTPSEVKPGQLAALREAALLVRVGLDHEPWLARVAPSPSTTRGSLPGSRHHLDASRGIALLQAETPRVRPRAGAHVHGLGNPHYWLDPENARPITAAILEALAAPRPRRARPAFEANRRRFLARLDAGLARWSRRDGALPRDARGGRARDAGRTSRAASAWWWWRPSSRRRACRPRRPRSRR